jgi:hypothetical protein
MSKFEFNDLQLADTAADSITNKGMVEEAALEARLTVLQERLAQAEGHNDPKETAGLQLEISRTLTGLGRGAEAWPLGRSAFDVVLENEDWVNSADICEVLFQAEQEGSLGALGQGLWLAVTYPVDPELSLALLHHVVDETPADSDGAAVAATTALFLVDIRARGKSRKSLKFFANQMLSTVARRHSGVETREAFDLWVERLELKEPDKFLARLRNVIDVLVQDDWWFDREALQARIPVN